MPLPDTKLNTAGMLAARIGKYCQRFVFVPTATKAVLPIWVMHTYVHRMFEHTPYLNVVSPEPGSGKSTFGDVLSSLCHNATSPMSGTAAALRRIVAAEEPTLIIDEWDSLDSQIRRACLNFLNTGYARNGTYTMCEGGEVVKLSTYCPKAIIGRSIVRLSEATLSRCIQVRLDRAIAEDKLKKFTEAPREEAAAPL